MRGSSPVSVEQALERLAEMTGPLPAETVALAEACGRVSAREVVAKISVPHFVRAAMDGYAVQSASTLGASEQAPRSLRVVGRSMPGRPASVVVGEGEAVAIATGAPVPEGADAVLMVEFATASSDRCTIAATREVPRGKHVGPIGEDIARGTAVMAKGRQLRPQDLGVLASLGASGVSVVRRPRVRILVTGDEILAPGSTPQGAKIPDANGLMLRALATRDGAACVEIAYVADRRADVQAALEAAAASDVVLVSGGSSVGPEDHAPSVLAERGELMVHGVAMRPAAPAGFGRMGGALVVLLPGNPVSSLCAYEFFAGPAIRALGGRSMEWPHAQVRAPVASEITSVSGRTDYCRVRLDGGKVVPIMTSGASILSSTTRADGVVIVPAESEGHAPGDEVTVLLYA